MKKTSLIACMGVFALWLGGCASEQASSPPASPSPAATQSPTATQSFSKPLVSEKNAAQKTAPLSTVKVPGLLQSTDPEERARQVQAGINAARKNQTDPFASLPPLVTFRPPGQTASRIGNDPQRAQQEQRTAQLPSLPNFPQVPPTLVARPNRGQGQTPNRFNTPSLPLSPPTITTLPPLPEPTLARAVEVSGVVVVGGIAQAIVKAPNEATSRYVRAGQRLSNGQILVKRIEVNGGSDPIVILEQNGVEVARAVGEKATPPGSPTASTPIQPRA